MVRGVEILFQRVSPWPVIHGSTMAELLGEPAQNGSRFCSETTWRVCSYRWNVGVPLVNLKPTTVSNGCIQALIAAVLLDTGAWCFRNWFLQSEHVVGVGDRVTPLFITLQTTARLWFRPDMVRLCSWLRHVQCECERENQDDSVTKLCPSSISSMTMRSESLNCIVYMYIYTYTSTYCNKDKEW